ncbi:MAG: hypothetical protein ACKOUQ_13570, partial [Aquirufa sp.]
MYQLFLFKVYFRSIPPFPEVAILALVVWFLYLLDRQVDNLFQPIQDERHQVHARHRKFYRVVIVLLGFSIACLLPF